MCFKPLPEHSFCLPFIRQVVRPKTLIKTMLHYVLFTEESSNQKWLICGCESQIGYLCFGTEIARLQREKERDMSSLLWTPELKIAHVMGRWHQVWTMSVIDRILVWLLLKLWLMNAKHHSFHPPLSAQRGFLSSRHTDWHVMQGSSSSS